MHFSPLHHIISLQSPDWAGQWIEAEHLNWEIKQEVYFQT